MPLSRPAGKANDFVAEGDPLPPEDRAGGIGPIAADALFRRERLRLFAFLRRRTSPEKADDLVQQTFVRFLAAEATRTAPLLCPEAYLRQTAHNLALDDLKSAKRRSAGLHIPYDDADLRAPDQIAALEARDVLQRLEAALLRLKPRTREIFLAHRIDGYSYGEIAVRTGLSVKGIEKHMSRAIAHIDRTLSRR